MEKIIGYVEHIVFRNEDNGYTVFHLHNEDGDLTCVGMFHYISEGEFLEVSGEYTNHAVYGSQLQVQEYRVKEPEDLHSIEGKVSPLNFLTILPASALPSPLIAPEPR